MAHAVLKPGEAPSAANGKATARGTDTTSSRDGGDDGTAPTVVAEVEQKFDVPEGFVLPDLTGLPGIAGVDQPEQQKLDAAYYDTSDLRLLRHRITLRRRTGGSDAGWHLKLPGTGHERSEVRLPPGRANSTVPAALVARVQVHARGHALVPVVRLRTHRTVHHLLDADGAALAEIAQDDVSASLLSAESPEASVVLWSELEVELTGGDRELLAAVAERLIAAGATPAAGPSKLARALADRLRSLPPVGPATLPERTAAAVVLAHLADHVTRLQTNDPLVRDDAEDAVHQMRVATRRLRSALATFRPLFDRQVTDPLRDELQWLGGVLGAARDAEVIRAHLRELVAAQPAELVLGPVRARIVTAMGTRYRAAHDAVLAELDGERYFALLESLDRLLAEPPLTKVATGKRDKVLLPLVAKSRRRVRRLHDQAAAETDPARHDVLLHEIRKAAKRARYAGEALTPAYGAPAKEWAARMEAIQEILGAHQDTVVIRDQIRQLAVAAHLDGENAFTYGLLHALEQARAERTERDYPGAWERADERKVNRWLDR